MLEEQFKGDRKMPLYIVTSVLVAGILILTGCSPYAALRHDPLGHVHGTTAPEFAEVKEAFIENFKDRNELGAACAVYFKGEKVVDLWGGYRDMTTRAPWEENTLVTVFSTSKGISAIALALLHARGKLNYDERVATYWPEFGCNGKQDITVRQLLGHEAGLCALDATLTIPMVGNLDSMAVLLAAQKPHWPPHTRHGYHAVSLGWYENELVRRLDERHRTIGQLVREDVCTPLGIRFFIGLPDSIADSQLAKLKSPTLLQALFSNGRMPAPLKKGLMNSKSLAFRSFFNPKVDLDIFNKRYALKPEVPSVNGTGTARAIASIYSLLADSCCRMGLDSNTLSQIYAPSIPPDSGSVDVIFGVPMNFSLGFMKPFTGFEFGTSRAAGHPGLGGSFAFADPDNRVSYAYAPNRLDLYPWNDPRDVALRKALGRCLERIGKGRFAIIDK
jgi:CubicO group peptidase (beta-lactamase class C family)